MTLTDIWDDYVNQQHLTRGICLVNIEITFPGVMRGTSDHYGEGKYVILNPCVPPIGFPVGKERIRPTVWRNSTSHGKNTIQKAEVTLGQVPALHLIL